MLQVYIGYDEREHEAYEVACKTLYKTSTIEAIPLVENRLRSQGLYWRNVDARGGRAYDLPSNAHASTAFAITRFFTPLLCQQGWALFTDCDVLFAEDVKPILRHADPSKAVMVVKHDHRQEGVKMDNQVQVPYPRKNWSSVMLFNCNHPANLRLTVEDINRRPGRDLHAFYWLSDNEIGELPPAWNWLVNVQDRPSNVKIIHYTNGGPWIAGWGPKPNDDIWLKAAKNG